MKKPSSNRTYKRNAFNLEFSIGDPTGGLEELFDDNYRFDIEETEMYYKSTLEIPMRKI